MAGTTLVVLNPTDKIQAAFDAGDMPVPEEMVREIVESVVHEGYIDGVMQTLGGLNLREIGETIRLTASTAKELTPRTILSTRKALSRSAKGLQMVDTSLELYEAPEEVKGWLKENAEFFSVQVHPKLRPRGVLFDGPPGTGKTMASKYIASILDVPLYRIDLGAMMGRYVGESESNLTGALRTIDHSAPCVVLFDEIEKVFQQADDTGVSSRMLSQLLWWLQEHKNLVLSIMTTNDADAIPEELHRPGRIDCTIRLEGMTSGEGEGLLHRLNEVLGKPLLPSDVTKTMFSLYGGQSAPEYIPPAQIEQAFIRAVKRKHTKEK